MHDTRKVKGRSGKACVLELRRLRERADEASAPRSFAGARRLADEASVPRNYFFLLLP
jgi:hypothetical protein